MTLMLEDARIRSCVAWADCRPSRRCAIVRLGVPMHGPKYFFQFFRFGGRPGARRDMGFREIFEPGPFRERRRKWMGKTRLAV